MTIIYKRDGAKLWDFGPYLVYAKTREEAEQELERYHKFLDDFGAELVSRGLATKGEVE